MVSVMFWIGVGVALVVVLAWGVLLDRRRRGWRDNRRSVAERDVAKAMGTLEGMRREPPSSHGGGTF